MKRTCIVGFGAIGHIHAAAIEKAENAEFYAVCDNNSERLNNCREKYDAVNYTDFDDMLLDENIDSVHICTPHYLHFEMIKKSLAAGKSVVCEKPVTMTRAEFNALLNIKDSGKVCVVLQNRLNPCIERFKEIADSGELGAVKTAKGIMTWCRTAEYYAQDEWRGRWATEGGGVLINQAIHTLDYFSYIVGKVSTVKAQMINYSLPEIEVEDTCTAHLRFENGATGIFFATNAYGSNSAPEFEVVFENGVVRYADSKLYVDGELAEQDSKPSLGKMYWGRGHERLISDYYDRGKYIAPKDIKNTMEIMFKMYESGRQRQLEL